MAKEKLTQGRVSAFTCSPDKGASFLWDAVTQGFGIKASKAGGKSFVFQDKLNGKDIRITIGAVSAWTLDKAREEARRLHTLVDQGVDPRQEKAERIAAGEAKRDEARRNEITVGEIWAEYIAERSSEWGTLHLRDHIAVASLGGDPVTKGRRKGQTVTQPGPLAALLPIRLSELTPDRVKDWLIKENANRPTRAALAFRLLRGFVKWCSEHSSYKDIVVADACTQDKVKARVTKAPSKAKDTMQREQLRPWFEAVRKINNPVISAYLQAMVLTGARREEMLSLRWTDVDFQWKSMTIRDKVEGERTIPLTPYVAALLADLPRRNNWVFSSPSAASGRLQEPRIQLERACIVAGIPKVTIHGLRRTFNNMAEWVQTPVGISAQIMGHKPSAIAEKHYTDRPLDLLRLWHTKIEAWILEQAGIEQPQDTSSGLRLASNNSKTAIL